MNIVYLYNRPTSDADEFSPDKVFADDPKTNRIELSDMVDMGVLHKGDTLYLRSRGDLGHGKAVGAIWDKIIAQGVTIKIVPKDRSKVKSQSGWMRPTDEQKAQVCTLWNSSLDTKHVLRRAGDVLGRKVERHHLNRMCGPRHK